MADATTAPPSMMNAAGPPSERIAPRRLFAFLIMVFGMFMSILDIQVVSASLSEIQAGLSASSSEVSWVQTSYLIAEVIAIPLSGFLSRAFGTRLLFAISASGFTIASFFCGFASSIEQMILWRVIQGFLGAGMIPTVFASAYTVFPREKFHIVGPIVGLVATLAPTVGPTVGGLITDMMSWHWLFFLNIIPGIRISIGVGLYGLTYIYPRYLAEVRGYSALMIGETLFVSGIAMFLTAPLVGRLTLKVDLRYLIAAGLCIFALGSYQMTWITRDYDFYELLVPQILRGIGMMFAMVPTNTIALGTLRPDRVKNASGLFNLTRNLGGAVGLAVINQGLNQRTVLHITRFQERVTWGNATATETLNMLTQRLQGMGDAALMAMKQLSQIVHRQAVVMGYGDAFFMLTVFYFGLSVLVMLLKKPASASTEPPH